jgi:tetratricopeptide (TPR) repeat protein
LSLKSATPQPISPIDAWQHSQGYFRVLLIISSPLDEPVRLNPVREIEEIYRQLEFSKVPVALIRLTPPTWHYLRTTLLSCQFDVVHFVGHTTENSIQLEKEDGTSDLITGEELAYLFEETNVRLVVLNSCSSEGLGDNLVTKRVPAIISTSNRIHTDAALLLSSNLYSMLFKGRTPKEIAETINHSIQREMKKSNIASVVALGHALNVALDRPSNSVGDPIFFSCNPVNNLPPLSRDVFYDRVDECLNLYDSLTRASLSSPFIGVTGIPGSGKSAVVLSSAWRYGWRFPKGIAYISMRQKPYSPLSLSRHFVWALDDVPSERLLAAIAYELAQGPYLLIFDDIESASEQEINSVIDLLQLWDTSLGGRAILIMRGRRAELDQIIQANWIQIGDLPTSASLELFQFHVGGEAAAIIKLGNDVEKIPDLCYRHPKLLQATASVLVSGKPWIEVIDSLRRLIGDPAQRSIQMLETTIDQIQAEIPLIAHFLDSWSAFAESCTEHAWRFIVNGGKISSNDPMWMLQSDALNTMQRVNILERFELAGEAQCKMHPLLNEYLRIRRWRELSVEKRKRYEHLHLDYYINLVSSPSLNAYSITSEWGNILQALKRARESGNWDGIIALCKGIVGSGDHLLIKKGPWDYAKEALTLGVDASEKLGNLKQQIIFMQNLGIISYRLSEFEASQKVYENSFEIAKQLDLLDLEIDALKGIGQVQYRTGDFMIAKVTYESALQLATDSGDTKRIADIKHQLGKVAYRQNDWHLAEKLFRLVLKTRRELRDERGVAKTLHELARIMHALERYSEAYKLYEESLSLRRAVNDPVGQQATLHQLGLLALDQGDYETARQYFDECTLLSDALNDRVWIAHNYYRRGLLLWAEGSYEKAINEVRKSLEMSIVMGIGLKNEIEKWLDTHQIF